MYESWLESWDPGQSSLYFRRGKGRDWVVGQAEFNEQIRRVTRHENNPRLGFVGPPLAYGLVCPPTEQFGHGSIEYLMEAAVDARILVTRLRAKLLARGVRFWDCDAMDETALAEVLSGVAAHNNEQLDAVVLAAGAWSLDLLAGWSGSLPAGVAAQSVRFSYGATAVLPASKVVAARDQGPALDFGSYVIEGLIHRSSREIAALTAQGDKLLLTSLNSPLNVDPASLALGLGRQPLGDVLRVRKMGSALGSGEALGVFGAEWVRARGLLHKHGLDLQAEPSALWTGIRLRLNARDLVCAEIPCPPKLGSLFLRVRRDGKKMPRVIFFAGANRSGFAYGPILAPQVVETLC
jgi:glycine/D-amino acid oxidase-like deaminating enzyme